MSGFSILLHQDFASPSPEPGHDRARGWATSPGSVDLGYRFDEGGWVTWYEPSATVIHVKAGTTGTVRSPRLN